MGGKLFISYSSDDRQWVNRLADALAAAGWESWVDHQEISGGAEWRTSIVRGLKTADAFLIVLSPSSVRSKNVVKELSLAEEFGRRIIPIQKTAAEEGSDVKYQLAGLQRVSFAELSWHEAMERLLAALDSSAESTQEAAALDEGTMPGTKPPTAPKRHSGRLAIGLLLVALAAAAAWWMTRSEGPEATVESSTPAPGTETPSAEPSAQPTSEAPAEAASVTLSRLVVAHEVVDSEPKRLKRAFRAGDKVYAFTEVRAESASRVSHRYSREGKVVHTSELDVKAGRYRTWSYVTARDPGPYKVVVLNASGEVLGSEGFNVRK